jgi:hypothetical protein
VKLRPLVSASPARLTFAVALICTFSAGAAWAVDQVHDEIQVCNADIAKVGQWTYVGNGKGVS